MKEDEIRPAELLDEYFRLLKLDAEELAKQSADFVEVPCPFCGGSRVAESFLKDGFHYRLCVGCGSLYVSPRPPADQLAAYYAGAKAVRFWSEQFYKQTAEARRKKMFRPRAQLICKLSEKRLFPDREIFVDVGAGYGLFLQELRSAGLFSRLIGLEPEPRLAAICRKEGFEIAEKWVEQVQEGEFDASAAACFEVIEHVFDPMAFLAGCGRTLKPGGVIVLTTLTIDGFDLQILWEKSRSITPPQHLNFPSLKGMSLLLERAGLVEEEISTPGELDLDIVRNVLKQHPEISVSRFVRRLAEADEDVRAEFQQFLRQNRLSSHLRCIARKPK